MTRPIQCPSCQERLPTTMDAFCSYCQEPLEFPKENEIDATRNQTIPESEIELANSTSLLVARKCPNCKGDSFTKTRPEFLAFQWDRICDSCGTRYTPPNPIWAGPLYLLAGLASLAISIFLYLNTTNRGMPSQGMFALGLIGLSCVLLSVKEMVYRTKAIDE